MGSIDHLVQSSISFCKDGKKFQVYRNTHCDPLNGLKKSMLSGRIENQRMQVWMKNITSVPETKAYVLQRPLVFQVPGRHS